MKIQKKFRIALVMTLSLLIASCGSKQNLAQTGRITFCLGMDE